ncbi:hypothetical protein [Azonexus sp. IMCC34839]|uniref:hypothetical protein n=1 Tax=Azonexus sp. IMCC34839 TaxID=3133695 RepID=UPI00399A28D8
MTALVPTPPMTSEAILVTLNAEATNERRRDTLLRLKEACDYLTNKDAEVRPSDIQRVIEKKFGKDAGPKAQSISNERKRSLGMYHYMEARERERLASKPPRKGRIHACRESATLRAIDRIDDMDVRSSMLDMYDRLAVAEKSLERAKMLLKTLHPRVDLAELLKGNPHPNAIKTSDFSISAEYIKALQRLVSILTDNEKMASVGLIFDGRRIRRKTGTCDELLDPKTLDGVIALSRQLIS